MFLRNRNKALAASAQDDENPQRLQSIPKHQQEQQTQQQQQPPLSPPRTKKVFGMLTTSCKNASQVKAEKASAPTSATRTSMRNRLDTEDTLRVNNVRSSSDQKMNSSLPALVMDDENPFLECHESYCQETLESKAQEQQVTPKQPDVVECASTVSSLASGSFKRPPGAVAITEDSSRPFNPPSIICFRVKAEVPDWLLGDDDDDQDDTVKNHVIEEESVLLDDSAMNLTTSCVSYPSARRAFQQSGTTHLCQYGDQQSLTTRTVEEDHTAENHRPQTSIPAVPQTPGATAIACPPRHTLSATIGIAKSHMSPLPPHGSCKQLQRQQQQQQQHKSAIVPVLPPVWTNMPSPANPRPTMGRYKSASSSCLGQTSQRDVTTLMSTLQLPQQETFPYSPCTASPMSLKRIAVTPTSCQLVPVSITPTSNHQRPQLSPAASPMRRQQQQQLSLQPMVGQVPLPSLAKGSSNPVMQGQVQPQQQQPPPLLKHTPQHLQKHFSKHKRAVSDGSWWGHGSLFTATTVTSTSSQSLEVVSSAIPTSTFQLMWQKAAAVKSPSSPTNSGDGLIVHKPPATGCLT